MTNVQSNISITAAQYATRPVAIPQTSKELLDLPYREFLWMRLNYPSKVDRLLNKA